MRVLTEPSILDECILMPLPMFVLWLKILNDGLSDPFFQFQLVFNNLQSYKHNILKMTIQWQKIMFSTITSNIGWLFYFNLLYFNILSNLINSRKYKISHKR